MRPVHYFIAFLTSFMLRSRGRNSPTLRSFILSCENSDGGSWRSSCGARSPYKHGGQAWCYDWSIQRDVTLWLAELMKLLCAEPCGSNLARAHLRSYFLLDFKPRSLARTPMEFNLVKSRSLISSSLFFPVSFLARVSLNCRYRAWRCLAMYDVIQINGLAETRTLDSNSIVIIIIANVLDDLSSTERKTQFYQLELLIWKKWKEETIQIREWERECLV